MGIDIKVPGVGESVTEALLAEWFKEDGASVGKDEPLFLIETDKVSLEVTAEADGVLHIKIAAGETVSVGTVVGTIDTEDAAADEKAEASSETKSEKETGPVDSGEEKSKAKQKKAARRGEETAEEQDEPKEKRAATERSAEKTTEEKAGDGTQPPLSPSVRRLAADKALDVSQITGTGPGGRITKSDVMLYLESAPSASSAGRSQTGPDPQNQKETDITRKKMSPIRRRIADHLLKAKQNTAMLTTFNEIDMTAVTAMRARYKEAFREKYDVSLGFMSFFIKASVDALKAFPEINAFIDGEEVIYHHRCHIGVAVGSEKGLVVPVIREAERLGFAELEQSIVDFVAKIRNNRLELADLEGGTFTISNGGVYGSLLSTPILNMPQSGILGMHKIEKRPVVIDDEVTIRPMMYVALSYDHRIVDGREAVGFLKRIKECVENPERMMMEI